jgi:hypothetical protein
LLQVCLGKKEYRYQVRLIYPATARLSSLSNALEVFSQLHLQRVACRGLDTVTNLVRNDEVQETATYRVPTFGPTRICWKPGLLVTLDDSVMVIEQLSSEGVKYGAESFATTV